ncbi:hypothetical protein CAEBREN_09450 [Caenorhabditis brenneri]|uniref:Piwi domain-containing protein n=1 Tax=Caenorhabditis brenneri TaxID=135651 RepID=G0PG59_CAEBE|nr:hypothetical protein CAEBREN_09450 [Caenorhabditis brenneri]
MNISISEERRLCIKAVYQIRGAKVLASLRTTNTNRGKLNDILIFFNGVSEGQFTLLNETFSSRVHEACAYLQKEYKPSVTIIASSKMHNERLYKSENSQLIEAQLDKLEYLENVEFSLKIVILLGTRVHAPRGRHECDAAIELFNEIADNFYEIIGD